MVADLVDSDALIGHRASRTVSRARWTDLVQRAAFVAVTLFVFSLPWERSLAVAGVGAFGRLVGIAAFALTLLMLFDRGALHFRRPSVFLILSSMFVLWAVSSVFWSADASPTIVRTGTYVQLLVMCWVLWQTITERHRHEIVMQAYVLGCYVTFFAVATSFLTGSPEGTTRYTAFSSNQNYLAQTLVLGIPMAWFLTLRRQSSLLWWVNPIYLPACMLVLGLAASRGALVMALAALLIVPLTLNKLSRRRRLVIAALLIAGAVFVYNLVPDANIARLAETGERLATVDLTSRERIWEAGLAVFLHPTTDWMLGTGSGTYSLVVEPLLGRQFASHNAYVSVLVELGIVGFVAFFSIMLAALIPVLFLPAPDRWLYVVLWLALAVAMSSSNWDYQRVTWFTWTLLTTRRAWVVGDASRRASTNVGAT